MKVIFTGFILLATSFYACKTGSKTTVKDIVDAQRNIMPPDSILQKQKRGIDLLAVGDSPAPWLLEMDFDKMISFRAADGTILDVLPSFDKRELSNGSEIYYLKTDLGPVVIEILNEPCTQNNVQYNKKATVSINGKTYTGCGKYLFNHLLNDSWVLESINNVPQAASNYAKGLPRMDLNLQTGKMTGSDGCNSISSTIDVKGDRIKFSPFTSTKMACSNNPAGEIFAKMLSDKLVDYFLENGKLVLYLGDDSKLYFKRRTL